MGAAGSEEVSTRSPSPTRKRQGAWVGQGKGGDGNRLRVGPTRPHGPRTWPHGALGMIHVLVVSDLHGAVWEALRLAVRVQEEHVGGDLAAVLCAGDLGYFPSPEHLDRATRRHAKRDPSELGFHAHFAAGSADMDQWLASLDRPAPRLYFIRGNHEDHRALQDIAGSDGPVAVDAYGLIHYLPDAVELELVGNDDVILRVAGLGGVEALDPARHHPLHGIQEGPVAALLGRRAGTIDVLLTHDVPSDMPGLGSVAGPGGETLPGSGPVAKVRRRLAPRYHFCGHLHRALEPVHIGSSAVLPLNALSDEPWQSFPNPNATALLSWGGPDDHGVEFVTSHWY